LALGGEALSRARLATGLLAPRLSSAEPRKTSKWHSPLVVELETFELCV